MHLLQTKGMKRSHRTVLCEGEISRWSFVVFFFFPSTSSILFLIFIEVLHLIDAIYLKVFAGRGK